MSRATRRDVLLAAAAIPVATALAETPLTADELRVLAMTATPPETWIGREREYGEHRIADAGSDAHRIVWDLRERGMVDLRPSPRDDCDWIAWVTPAGREALRRAGV